MIVIGVAGASGSGKTLLANSIVEAIGSNEVIVISEDRYYHDNSHLSLEKRAKINFDHPDAFDHALLYSQIQTLKAGNSINVPSYNYHTHARDGDACLRVDSGIRILVLEGILLFHEPELRDLMDIKVYMDTPLDVSFIRRLRRDITERGRTVECVLDQYATTVRPMFTQFIEPSKRHADIIVPNGGKNQIAIDVIRARLKEIIA